MGYLSKIVELFVVASIMQNTAGLKCPKCSYVTVTNVPGSLKSAVDTILSSLQEVKCSQELTGPIPEIKEETCEAPSGEEARCSWYKGTLTMKIPLLNTEFQFLINTRGCYYAKAAAVPVNGCHDLSNLNEDKSKLVAFTKLLNSPYFGLKSFQGKRCLTTETYGDMSSAASYFYKLPLNLVIGNVLVMFVLKYV